MRQCVYYVAEGIALVRQNNVRRHMAFPAQGKSNHFYLNLTELTDDTTEQRSVNATKTKPIHRPVFLDGSDCVASARPPLL